MPRKTKHTPVETVVGTIREVRVEPRPRRDPLISLLVSLRAADGGRDEWCRVAAPLAPRLLAVHERESLVGLYRSLQLDAEGCVVAMQVP
jgi:hypothetical protein